MLHTIRILVRRLYRRRAGAAQAAFAGLLSPEQFTRALERERARTDRTGEEFSLLLFAGEDRRNAPELLAHLASIMRRRLRQTDEIGRLDSHRLAALLPNTPGWGAWSVADDVCRSLPASSPRPVCMVYCYPSDWTTPGGGAADGSRRLADAQAAVEEQRPIRAMEGLFLRRLPLWKRSLDVLGATAGLMLLAPLLLLVAAMVKLTSRGGVLFAQQRIGIGGRPFTMYKYRTMVVDAEAQQEGLWQKNERDGPVFKIKNDPRITPIGRFLRQTSIDELPQLWNVLREMSLVGPRPPIHREVVQYQTWQRRRLDVTPGLTCIWQVRGRALASFADWVRMDVQYIRARSFLADLKLLLQTVPAVLARRGAS